MYKKKEKVSAFELKERELKIIKRTIKYVFKKELSDYNGFISDEETRLQRNIVLSFMFNLGINVDESSEILECKPNVITQSLYFNDWALGSPYKNQSYVESYYAFMEEFNDIKDIYKEKERDDNDIYK